MIHMPFVSAVLEMRYSNSSSSSLPTSQQRAPHPLFPSPSFPANGTFLYRDLAAAAGLLHFTLDCQVPPSSLATNMYLAIEALAFYVYSSPAFDTHLLEAQGRGYEGNVPGLAAQGGNAVSQLTAWQQCVAQQGRWVKDGTPRRLPWHYTGSMDRCDRLHVEAGGKAGMEADAVADRWQADASAYAGKSNGSAAALGTARKEAEDSWNVREGLKYVWDTQGQCQGWDRLSDRAICPLARSKGKGERSLNLLLIGDSMTVQLSTTLANTLAMLSGKPAGRAVEATSVQDCSRWVFSEPDRDTRGFCVTYHVAASSACPDVTFNVMFLRHYWMYLSSHKRDVENAPWSRMPAAVAWADAVVVNRGAHFCNHGAFRAGMRASLRHLRNMAPDKLIIARGTPPGHVDCGSYSAPINEPQDMSAQPYNWDKFGAQDQIVKEEVSAIGGVYMDVTTMTALRPDGHRLVSIHNPNATDCFHYCEPGPVDTWVQLLLNTLRQAWRSG